MAQNDKVLVIDDDDVLLDLMMRRLQRIGLAPDRAENGQEGLDLVAKKVYDLVVTDIYMPKATGLDILDAAKKKDPQTQVVAITGGATIEMALEALEKGAFAYLTKPFDHLKVFDHTVQQALRFRKMLAGGGEFVETSRPEPQASADESEVLRQMTEELLRVMQFIQDALFIIDTNGEVVLANPSAVALMETGWDFTHLSKKEFNTASNGRANNPGAKVKINGSPYNLRIVELPVSEDETSMLFLLQSIAVDQPRPVINIDKQLDALKKGIAWLYQQRMRERSEFRVLRALANQISILERYQESNGGSGTALEHLLAAEDALVEEESRVLVDGPQ